MANFVSTISGNPDTYQGTNPFDPSYGQNAENRWQQAKMQGVQQDPWSGALKSNEWSGSKSCRYSA